MKAIREKVRAITGARPRLKQSLKEIIDDLNPVLRGWGNYFAVGNSANQLSAVDNYVKERLCRL